VLLYRANGWERNIPKESKKPLQEWPASGVEAIERNTAINTSSPYSTLNLNRKDPDIRKF
jgi:hypothetical protein